MIHFGPTELIILLVIIVLLFGVGRIGRIAGEFGKGVRNFKKEIKGAEKTETEKSKG